MSDAPLCCRLQGVKRPAVHKLQTPMTAEMHSAAPADGQWLQLQGQCMADMPWSKISWKSQVVLEQAWQHLQAYLCWLMSELCTAHARPKQAKTENESKLSVRNPPTSC